MAAHVLLVDDEAPILDSLRRMLRLQRAPWRMSFAQSVDEALELVQAEPVDAIVTDVMMPLKDGFDLLDAVRSCPETCNVPVVILTGQNQADLKRRALNCGATDLLSKPIEPEDLMARLRSVLELKAYQDQLLEQKESLERQVADRTSELTASRLEIIWRLGKAAEYRDEETGHHVIRVACYCRELAQVMGMPKAFVETIFLAAPLHDIGKIGIPDEVLRKKGKLTEQEWDIMKQHCRIGAEILQDDPHLRRAVVARHPMLSLSKPLPTSNPLIQMGSTIALSHHEWWNGSGYPAGLAGARIPLEGRLLAVADVYDALRSARPYKRAFDEARTLEIMDAESARHFDPDVYAAFRKAVPALAEIRAEFSDNMDAAMAGA